MVGGCAAHGFFGLECRACLQLGQRAVEEERYEEGIALLQNALAGTTNEVYYTIFEVRLKFTTRVGVVRQ